MVLISIDECRAIPFFSNPEVSYDGYPIGIPEGEPDSADAAKTINNTTHILANCRPSMITDSDNDGVDDDMDNYFDIYNPDQADYDGDAVGDVCDNCSAKANGPFLGTCTSGFIGNTCINNEACGIDGFCSMEQKDADKDGVGDVCDNCFAKPNGPWEGTCRSIDNESEQSCIKNFYDFFCGEQTPCIQNQEDTDSDGIGNVCDDCTDTDEDGYGDPSFPYNACDEDNCPNVFNEDQINSDNDYYGNACDNCWYEDNPNQADSNGNCPPIPYSSDPECGDACESTPTTSPTTTTTTTTICGMQLIYGENSEEVELLRDFRDNLLSQTTEGQKIIELYYLWSPIIVKAMEQDEEFKEEAKELIDGVLPLIRGVE